MTAGHDYSGSASSLPAADGRLGRARHSGRKRLTTDDVTAQHTHVAARLATKRVIEKRYIDLLTRARKISEVLEVEEKIG